MKKFFLIFIVIFLIILLLVSILFINKLNKINFVEIPKEEIEISDGVKEKLNEYRNIVLLGIDNKDDYVGRSDCIIIFSLNEKTGKVKMTSIYRDTYVEVPNHGYTKINHAYAYGKETLALTTINRNLDLDIEDFVTINFEVVKMVVDYLGGVEINLTDAEASQIDGIDKAGTYNLNGEQALKYGRTRYIDTDYKRTERMRNVIIKCFEKIQNMSLIELNDFLDRLLPEIRTNIDKKEITKVLTKLNDIKIENSMGWPYEVSGQIIDKVWYGIPVNLKDCVQKLHKDLFEQENYETTTVVNDISQKIIEMTGVK